MCEECGSRTTSKQVVLSLSSSCAVRCPLHSSDLDEDRPPLSSVQLLKMAELFKAELSVKWCYDYYVAMLPDSFDGS